MLITILSVLGTIFSLGGNLLIMFKKRSGWLAWIVGNILWITINFIGTMNWPMVIMYVVYLIINVTAFIKWKEKT